jgi:hypothetical protein
MTAADDKDLSWGAETLLTQCLLCKHRAAGPHLVCAAFPNSIPPEIAANDFDHRQPWIDQSTGQPGDQGVPLKGSILFEPRAGINPVTLDVLYRHLDAL